MLGCASSTQDPFDRASVLSPRFVASSPRSSPGSRMANVSKSAPDAKRTAARLDTWRGFATMYGVDSRHLLRLANFGLRTLALLPTDGNEHASNHDRCDTRPDRDVHRLLLFHRELDRPELDLVGLLREREAAEYDAQ